MSNSSTSPPFLPSSPKDIVNYVSDPSNWPYLITGGLSTAAFVYYMVPKITASASGSSSGNHVVDHMGDGKKNDELHNKVQSYLKPHPPVAYKPVQLPAKLSKLVPGDERIRISILCKNDKPEDRWVPGLTRATMYDVFMTGHKKSANLSCLGYRKKILPKGQSKNEEPLKTEEWEPEYTWMTYEQVRHSAHAIGSGLISLGMKPAEGSKIGIYSINRPEWDITQLSCSMFSYIVVPLYDTQSIEGQIYIINQTELKLICVDNEDKVKKLLNCGDKIPSLETIVCFDETIAESTWGAIQAAGLKLLTYSQLKAFGGEDLKPMCIAKPDDIFIILYTSGTTGVPKGVVLKQKNIVANIESIFRNFRSYEESDTYSPTPRDCYISYLPNAHGFNQVCVGAFLCYGSRIGYYRGDVKLLLEDAQALHPTFFPMVPRLLNRLYSGVKGKVKGNKLKEYLMERGIKVKRKSVQAGVYERNTFYDKLVFSKIQKMLGGSVRLMVSGAAPVSSEVMEFVQCAMGCPVAEGYGQSECTAAATLTLPGQRSLGNVGSPLPCCEIKLVDIPEMGYYSKEDKGEVCFRGSHCFEGYYKDEKNTREVLDDLGWVHSGDVGAWSEDGTLKLIDRKKHIFKLAQGEYVAPEKVEGVYTQCPLVAQIYVHGDSFQFCCVGICVPEEELLRQTAREENIADVATMTFSQMCKNATIIEMVLTKLNQHATEKNLNSLEKIRALYLHDEVLTPESGLLTPTLKTKRSEVAKYFSTQINELYRSLSEAEENKRQQTAKL